MHKLVCFLFLTFTVIQLIRADDDLADSKKATVQTEISQSDEVRKKLTESETDSTFSPDDEEDDKKKTKSPKSTRKSSGKPLFEPTGPPSEVKNHGDIERYLVDFFLFENSKIRDYKTGTANEVYLGHGLNYDEYIFNAQLGTIVQSGPKTRAYHLPGKKCVHMKKLYQWFNKKTKTSRLTLNFLDVNNKGDRQPIGFCAPGLGVCGADLPIYEYVGYHNVSSDNQQKQVFFYATTDKFEFSPEKKNYTLGNPNPLCYIHSISEVHRLGNIAKDNRVNLKLGNIASELRPFYELYYSGDRFYATNYTHFENSITRHVFNLLKPDSYLVDRCGKFNITTFVCSVNGTNVDLLSTNEASSKQINDYCSGLGKNITSSEHLGFAMADTRCGPTIRYEIYRHNSTDTFRDTMYVVREGQKEQPNDYPFFNQFFYSY